MDGSSTCVPPLKIKTDETNQTVESEREGGWGENQIRQMRQKMKRFKEKGGKNGNVEKVRKGE